MQDFIFFNLIDLSIAAIIDYLIGDPEGFIHPVVLIGKLIKMLCMYYRQRRKIWRPIEETSATRTSNFKLVRFPL